MTDGLPGVLQRDAEGTLRQAALRQLRHQHDREQSTEFQNAEGDNSEDESETLDLPNDNAEPMTPSSRFSSISEGFRTRRLSFPFGQKAKEPWKEPHSYEVLRAIENKDLTYLMVCGSLSPIRTQLNWSQEVRDRAFHVSAPAHHTFGIQHVWQLLLRKTGDVTPLLHAMRIGPSHREVSGCHGYSTVSSSMCPGCSRTCRSFESLGKPSGR